MFHEILDIIKRDKDLFILFIIKDFIGMLSVWQLDHTFSYLVWSNNKLVEIARIFTIPIYMYLTDFWILCIFIILLAIYLPDLYLIAKYLNKKAD